MWKKVVPSKPDPNPTSVTLGEDKNGNLENKESTGSEGTIRGSKLGEGMLEKVWK